MAINRYTTPIQQSQEQYIGLPFQEMLQAGQAIQQRGDLAEGQIAAVETGLGSMEAVAPAYAQFRDKFVTDFKTQASALLDQYGGNTSDPDFIRASKKLNLTFAADPRLQTIKQGNEFLKSQQKISQELAARGVKAIDPNRSFTGIDQNGRLTVPTAGVRGTNFDEDLTKAFLQIKDNMVDNGRGWKSNKGNLDRLAGNLIANLETNPITKDAIDYYKQQGLDDKQARAATQGLIKQAYTDNLRTDRDYAYDNLQLSKQQLALAKAKASGTNMPSQLPFELLSYHKPITPNTNQDVAKSETRTTVQKILKDLTSDGNLKSAKRIVADTPENRKKYGDSAKPVTQTVTGSGLGYGGGGQYAGLEVSTTDKDQINLMTTARKVLGIKAGTGTAKEIFKRYDDFLAQYDNAANSIKSTDNTKINNATAEVARRQIASGEVYTIDKGNLTKVNLEKLDEKDAESLANIKDTDISGISSKNLGELSGYTQFTDKKGKIYYTPIPEEYQRKFAGSKVVENYLQDFDPKNLKEQSIGFRDSQGGTKEVKVFINPNQAALPYVYKGFRGNLIPYKTNQNGKLVAGAIFQTANGYAPIPLSELEDNEFKSLYSTVGNNNKIQGNE